MTIAALDGPGRSPTVVRLAVLALAACAGHAQPPAAPARGATAPDVAPIDLAGRAVRLVALRGHPIVLDFWESTCEPCLRALPALAALAARHERLVIVSITPESPSDPLRAFVAEHRMSWIVATDEADVVSAAFRVPAYPTYFLVDEAGAIACARCSLQEIERELAARR
jgi:thiol-disulfide isomerase/thioredoxin